MRYYEYDYILFLRGTDFSPQKSDLPAELPFKRQFEKGDFMSKTKKYQHIKGGVEIHSRKEESLEKFLKRVALLKKEDLERNGIDYVGFEIYVKHWDNDPDIPLERAIFNRVRELTFIREMVIKFRWQNARLAFLPYEGDTEFYLKKQIQFGEAMRAARESKQISYQAVTERFGISEKSLKKIEQGKAKVEYWLVKELENFYAVRIDDFLGEKKPLE